MKNLLKKVHAWIGIAAYTHPLGDYGPLEVTITDCCATVTTRDGRKTEMNFAGGDGYYRAFSAFRNPGIFIISDNAALPADEIVHVEFTIKERKELTRAGNIHAMKQAGATVQDMQGKQEASP